MEYSLELNTVNIGYIEKTQILHTYTSARNLSSFIEEETWM